MFAESVWCTWEKSMWSLSREMGESALTSDEVNYAFTKNANLLHISRITMLYNDAFTVANIAR